MLEIFLGFSTRGARYPFKNDFKKIGERALDNYLESYSIPFLNVGNVEMNDFKQSNHNN